MRRPPRECHTLRASPMYKLDYDTRLALWFIGEHNGAAGRSQGCIFEVSDVDARRIQEKIYVSSTATSRPSPMWIKARASMASGACVELAQVDDMIALRDSKNPEVAPLYYTVAEITAFFDGVRKGEFDHLLDIHGLI